MFWGLVNSSKVRGVCILFSQGFVENSLVLLSEWVDDNFCAESIFVTIVHGNYRSLKQKVFRTECKEGKKSSMLQYCVEKGRLIRNLYRYAPEIKAWFKIQIKQIIKTFINQYINNIYGKYFKLWKLFQKIFLKIPLKY